VCTADIENFPHALSRIVMFWGTHQFDDVIDGMTMDWIRFNRHGWPDSVFRELTLLHDVHNMAFPHLCRRMDPWDVKGVGISK